MNPMEMEMDSEDTQAGRQAAFRLMWLQNACLLGYSEGAE
jgi:hypothetical protein